MYYWNAHAGNVGSLESFLADGLPPNLRRFGIETYTIDGEVVVDMLCRYENLESDLESARKTIGLREPLVLPNAKSGIRPPDTSFERVLAPECIDQIAKHCRDELEILSSLS